MPAFEPTANERFSLTLEGRDRQFVAVEHPSGRGYAHAAEGAKATVYRIRDVGSGGEYALKVMKTRFRDPALELTCEQLDRLKTLPGMEVCERRCLSPGAAPESLKRYRNLEYAILMPWVQGLSWVDVLQWDSGGGAVLGREECLTLALRFAAVLTALEERGIAHCDLSSGNVIVDPRTLEPSLIDVEDIYADGMQPPSAIPLGTPGYQHRTSEQGMWRIEADRFAGPVLLAEMLGWYHHEVRAASYGESYFDPAEMQADGLPRLRTLQRAIEEQGRSGSPASRAVSELLERAWASATLEECPPLSAWREALEHMRRGLTFLPLPQPSPRQAVRPFWTELPDAPAPKRAEVQWILPTQIVPERTRPVVTWGAPVGASSPVDPFQPSGGAAPGTPVPEAYDVEPL